MLLNIVTPHKKIITDVEVDEVLVPAHSGELGILPGHAPLISTLEIGVMKYKLKGESNYQSVVITWGYLQVTPTSINILSETAEEPYEIDLSRAVKAVTESEKMIVAGNMTLAEIEKYQRKLKRAHVRKAAAEENKSVH